MRLTPPPTERGHGPVVKASSRILATVAAHALSVCLLTSNGLAGGLLQPALAGAPPLNAEQKLAMEAWKETDRIFVDRTFGDQDWFQRRGKLLKATKVGSREETYDEIRSMLKSVDDKYTRFLTPAMYGAVYSVATGDVAGVGVELAAEPRADGKGTEVTFTTIFEGSPAEKAGLKVGHGEVEPLSHTYPHPRLKVGPWGGRALLLLPTHKLLPGPGPGSFTLPPTLTPTGRRTQPQPHPDPDTPTGRNPDTPTGRNPDTPTGRKAGDVLLAVDGNVLPSSISAEETSAKVRGGAGSKVGLQLRRVGAGADEKEVSSSHSTKKCTMYCTTYALCNALCNALYNALCDALYNALCDAGRDHRAGQGEDRRGELQRGRQGGSDPDPQLLDDDRRRREEGEEKSSLHKPCTCHVHAMQMPCTCHANAMHTLLRTWKAIEAMQPKGISKLVIDLRGNTGGYFPGGVDVARLLLPDKTDISFVSDYKVDSISPEPSLHLH